MDFSWEEIEEKKNIFSNCLQATFSYICSIYGKDIEKTFSLGLGIRYEKKKGTYLGCKIYPNIRYSFVDFYRDEYGFNIKKQLNISKESIVKVIEEGKVCLIRFDAYYCKWNPAYREMHLFHYAIVDNLELFTGRIKVLDPYISSEAYMSDIDEMILGITDIYSLEDVGEETELNFQHLCELVIYGKSLEQTKQCYKEMIDDFEKIRKVEDLFEKKASSNNPLIVLISQIESSHYALLYILWKKSKEEGSESKIESLLIKIWEISKNWGRLKLILVRINIIYKLQPKHIVQITEILKKQMELELEVINFIDSLRNCAN